MVLPRLKCLRCGYEWIPRKDELPKTCTKCNSLYWNKPRKIRHAGVYEPTAKVCKDCGQEKPLSEFKQVTSRPGGKGTKEYQIPDSVCVDCRKARYREWYKTHPQADRLKKFRQDHATCDYTKSGFYLGVVVAEKVLSTMFEHVERMPNNTPGYDFDTRESLEPVHAWLIPGSDINHLTGLRIGNTEYGIKKWLDYERPIDKIIECCRQLRERP